MNINPIIESALSGLQHNGKAVNIAPLVLDATKKGDCYCTYYTYLDRDEAFADDEPQDSVTYGTVDLFCKGNHKTTIREIKTRLRAAGLMLGDVGPELYEDDTRYTHIPINFYIEDTEE